MDRAKLLEPPSPRENRLLAALPAEDFARLRPHMKLTALPLGRVLHESSAQVRHLYFPVSGLVSLLYTLQDGATAELAVVGNDGCVGLAILLGGGTTPSRAVVQIAGHAYQVPSAAILEEFRRQGRLQSMLLRYIQARIAQVSQVAVCNRHHSVEQQLCRWLLLSLDRVPTSDIRVTHEQVSNMLGVRRTGITQAARTLARAGLIENRRGVIEVSDRAKLEAHACECYAAIKRETDRLFSSGSDGPHALVAPGTAGSSGP